MKKIKNLIRTIEWVLEIPNLHTTSREAKYIEARAIFYTILREHLNLTYAQIGTLVNKTHATIINAYKSFPYMVKNKPYLQIDLNIIEELWGYKKKPNATNLSINQEKNVENLQERNKVLILWTQDLKRKLHMVFYHRYECKYTTTDVDKIENYKTWSDKKKIDTLLHIDCNQYCNLGIDSTLKEVQEVKTKSRIIYRTIKRINESAGKLFLQAMD
jgi:hypothetical protein